MNAPMTKATTNAAATAIPFEHREALKTIDIAFGKELCQTVINYLQEPTAFAQTCFDFLDAIGDEPVKPLAFLTYLRRHNFGATAQMLAKAALQYNPGLLSSTLA